MRYATHPGNRPTAELEAIPRDDDFPYVLHDFEETLGMTTTREMLTKALTENASALVARLLEKGSTRILVAHIPEEQFGLGQAVVLAIEEAKVHLYDVNPAWSLAIERMSQAGTIRDVLVTRTMGSNPAVVWLTGWGSRPREADELLRFLAPIVKADESLRLAILNNASAIPFDFPDHGPVAWPDSESFAVHVADLAGVDRSEIDLWTPESTGLDLHVD